MAGTQENAIVAPVAGPTDTPDRPTAAPEQTESAPVDNGSDAAHNPETADEPADETGAENAEGKKPKSKIQKDFDRLTRQRGRLERENAAMAERLAKLESKAESTEAPKSPSSDKPRLENFGSYDEWQEALTDWKVDQKLKANEDRQRQSAKQRQTAETNRERQERFLESSELAREKYDDFDDVVLGPENKVTPIMAALIADTDNPGEVAYFLATNPKEAQRIQSLRPEKAAIELGKLEVRLTAPKPKQVSSAPPPTSTPAGGGRAVPKSPSKMTPDEIYARFKG